MAFMPTASYTMAFMPSVATGDSPDTLLNLCRSTASCMMAFMPSVATGDSPDTLLDLCICYCTKNLAVLARTSGQRNDGDDNGTENRTCQLPLSVGNRLLDHYLKGCVPTAESRPHVDALFHNRGLCSTVEISRMHMLSDRNLVGLSHNHITDLSIIGCEGITKSSDSDGGNDALEPVCDVLGNCSVGEGLKALFVRNRQNLKSLKVKLLEPDCAVEYLFQAISYQDDNSGLADMNMDDFHFSNMKTLTYQSTVVVHLTGIHWLACMVRSNRQLTVCNFTFPVSPRTYMYCMEEQLYQNLPNLVYLHSLVLSNTARQPHSQHDASFFTCLAHLKHLRHLDLSSFGYMKYTDAAIAEFIHFLQVSTQLRSLDIWGTNLTYIVRHEPHVDKECRGTCMPDFPGRQFEYLGLGVRPECRHKCIPARKVSGVDSPEQLVVAVWSYQHNQAIMGHVLIELNHRLLRNDDAMSTLIVQKPHLVCEMFKGLLAYVEKLLDWHKEELGKYKLYQLLMSFDRLLRVYNRATRLYNRATNPSTRNYLLTVTARR